MASAGTVTVDFAAETAKFTAELKKIRKDLSSMQSSFDALGKAAKAAFAAFSVGAITSFIKSAADAADELGKTADKLGVSTERLTAFQLAAKDAGVETQTLNKLLVDAQRRLGDAAGGQGEALQTLRDFGFSIRELQKLSPDELFLKYADAIGTLGTRSEQFAAAQKLFGKSAQEAFTLIDAGRPAIEAAAETVDKLGLALSRVDIKVIEEANDKLGLLGQTSQAIGQQIAVAIAPFVTAIVDGFTNSGVSADSFRVKIEQAMAVGFFAFETLRNGVKALEAAFFGAAAAEAKWLELLARINNFGRESDISKAFGDSAALNLQKAKDALGQIQSFAQISDQYAQIIENARQRAIEAVEQQKAATPSGTPADNTFTLDPSLQQFQDTEIALASHYQAMLDQQQIFSDASIALTELTANSESAIRQQQLDREAAQLQAANDAMVSSKQAALNAIYGLLATLAQKSKAAAIALVLINKAQAIAQAIQNTLLGATLQLTSGDPYTAVARAELVKTYGFIQVAAIAATGALEIGNIASSGGGGHRGAGGFSTSAGNSVFSDSGDDQQYGATAQKAVQITINGFVGPAILDEMIDAIKDAVTDRDVVIINQGSRQALELAGG